MRAPQLSVARSTFNERLWKKALVAVVDSVVSSMRNADQELRIKDAIFTIDHMGDGHWIHVVNKNSALDLMILSAQITPIVANDDVISQLTPLPRAIERLVNVSIETEGGFTNNSS